MGSPNNLPKYDIVFQDVVLGGIGDVRRAKIVFVDSTETICLGLCRNRRCLTS